MFSVRAVEVVIYRITPPCESIGIDISLDKDRVRESTISCILSILPNGCSEGWWLTVVSLLEGMLMVFDLVFWLPFMAWLMDSVHFMSDDGLLKSLRLW